MTGSNYASPRSIVIIPTYNEADNIATVLELIMTLEEPVFVLVIDDGSPDGTARRVCAAMEEYPGRIDLIEREGKQGLGSAYLTGFTYALEHGFEFICEMDADLSHNPQDLPRLIAPVREDRADVTVGSRDRFSPGRGQQNCRLDGSHVASPVRPRCILLYRSDWLELRLAAIDRNHSDL